MDNTITNERDKGFTLIELLIVIVILGILATVTVFAVSGITNRGNDSACASDLKTLEVAIEAYNAQNNAYPTSQAQLVSGGFLRSASTKFDTGGGGVVTKTDTSCPQTP